MRLFDVLQGTATLEDLAELTDEQKKRSTSKWKDAINVGYMQWWTRPNHLGMRELCPNNFGNNDGVKELNITPAF